MKQVLFLSSSFYYFSSLNSKNTVIFNVTQNTKIFVTGEGINDNAKDEVQKGDVDNDEESQIKYVPKDKSIYIV